MGGKTKGLYKRGRIWWLCYSDPFGKTHFESSRSTSMKDAEYLLVCRRKEVQEGKNPEVKRIKNHSFRELSEMYLKWAERQRCFNTKRCLVQQLAGVLGSYPLKSFTPRLIEEWQSELMHRLKPATCNRFLATLKHMFTKAVDWELTGEDILRKVRKVKPIKENNRRLRFLSKEECQALIEACSQHLRPIVVAALNTGMRKGEILGLKWEQVDLKHGFILLDNTKNGDCRQIPINSTLRATLEAIPHGLESEYVFTKNNGTRYKFVEHSYTLACRRAGLTNFLFHDLRHTAASHLVMAGVDLTTVKELLGHKTLNMTLRYSHLSSEHKANALKLLENRIGNDGEDSRSCT